MTWFCGIFVSELPRILILMILEHSVSFEAIASSQFLFCSVLFFSRFATKSNISSQLLSSVLSLYSKKKKKNFYPPCNSIESSLFTYSASQPSVSVLFKVYLVGFCSVLTALLSGIYRKQEIERKTQWYRFDEGTSA